MIMGVEGFFSGGRASRIVSTAVNSGEISFYEHKTKRKICFS